MPVVDVHCHIYPSKVSEKAVASVGEFYRLEMFGSTPIEGVTRGTVEHLLAVSANAGITHHVVHSVAVKPKTVEPINDFIASECSIHSNLIGFMAMHQDYESPAEEIERAVSLGLKGIKIHPDTQHVNLDDPRLMRVYEIAEKRNIPLIIHTGDYRYDYSHPRRMKEVLHSFPNLVVDAAHFGGWSIYDLALEYLEDERCFVDISSSMAALGLRRTRELIELYGVDRVLFGSDFPMWSPAGELNRLKALNLNQEDYERITWHNIERFLGLDII